MLLRGAPRASGMRRVVGVMPMACRGKSGVASSPAVVQVERRPDGIAHVVLSRPSKMNALSMDMFRSIRDAAKSLIADSSVRVVVISGEGRAFCAGLDLKGLISEPLSAKANMEELLHRPEGEVSNLAQDVGYLWRKVPCPVITALHGVCFGGGLQIALGADIRIAHPSTKLSVMEAKWGLVPDMSATVTLPELVPKDVAMELTLTGRIFDGEEALKLGLVTRLSEQPLESALKLAKEIASKSPDAAAAAKRLLHATYTDAPDDARNLRLETELQKQLIGGWNQAAMVAKGLGAPSFLQPSMANRSGQWDEEADAQAEAEVRRMLDGSLTPSAASTSTTPSSGASSSSAM